MPKEMKILNREEYKALLDDPDYVVEKAHLYQKPTHWADLGKSAPRVPLIVRKKK